jgi:hypothetical protein
MAKQPPKFRVGQVVSVKSFFGNFAKGETGPGFEGKRGWRHGFDFGKIVKVSVTPNKPPFIPTAPHCYFLDGWISARTETDLRALTVREREIKRRTR